MNPGNFLMVFRLSFRRGLAFAHGELDTAQLGLEFAARRKRLGHQLGRQSCVLGSR